MLQWHWRKFNELTNQELYDILAVREAVFILEQKCFYPDIDYKDINCTHLLGIQDNKLAAYLRVLPKNTSYPGAISFGRVLTAPFARGNGIGKELIQQTLLYLEQQGNTLPIIISAQHYLEKFYQSFGFKTESDVYDEDGIPHIKMKRS